MVRCALDRIWGAALYSILPRPAARSVCAGRGFGAGYAGGPVMVLMGRGDVSRKSVIILWRLRADQGKVVRDRCLHECEPTAAPVSPTLTRPARGVGVLCVRRHVTLSECCCELWISTVCGWQFSLG